MPLSRHNVAVTRRGDPVYVLTHEHDGTGGTKHYCTLTCAVGGEHVKISWSGGRDPQLVAKRWRNLGWDFDAYNANRCVCPEHKSKREKLMQSTSPQATITGLNGPAKAKASMKPPPEVPALDIPQPRALTAEERTAVRHLLDLHFDDNRGTFIDGYSDRRIGEETNTPWASVAQLREAAYGPIREDARVAPLRKELLATAREVAQLQEQIAAIKDEVRGLEGKAALTLARISQAEATLNEINAL